MIYLDANLVIYVFEDEGEIGDRVRSALARIDPGQRAVSPLVKLECMVGPLKKGNLVRQKYFEEGLASFVMLPMPDEVYEDAAHLRARFGLKTPDALHLACAQHHGCEALWTNDDRLAKAGHGLAVNILA